MPWRNGLQSFFEPWPEGVLGVLLGALAAAVFTLAAPRLRRLRDRFPRRLLLGRLANEKATINLFLRGLFVPNNEFFSREPEQEPGMSGTITVRKWANIPEVYGAADVRAVTDLLRLLGEVAGEQSITFRPVEAEKNWSEDAIAVGAHFKALQILDACEPRIIAFRHPDGFRSLVSRHLFVAAGQTDYGLIYRGYHPANGKAFLVVMGPGPLGTEAAAHFLRVNARGLGYLTAGTPFAAVIAVDLAQGRQGGVLHWLHPKPAWWRRLLFWAYWKPMSRKLVAPAPVK